MDKLRKLFGLPPKHIPNVGEFHIGSLIMINGEVYRFIHFQRSMDGDGYIRPSEIRLESVGTRENFSRE